MSCLIRYFDEGSRQGGPFCPRASFGQRLGHRSRTRLRAVVLALAITVALVSSHANAADAVRWIIVQPGYPGSTAEAEGFMRRFSADLAAQSGIESLEGSYHNVPESAAKVIEEKKPAFGLVSLGFYLRYRRQFGLDAQLESEPGDRVVAVVRAGSFRRLKDLAGKKVAGGPLYEPEFLRRVVLGKEAAIDAWQIRPTLRVSRALRRLHRGRVDAVVLTGREFAALGEVSPGKKVEKLLESEYYPESIFVFFSLPARPLRKDQRQGTGPGTGGGAKTALQGRLRPESCSAIEEKKDQGQSEETTRSESLARHARGGLRAAQLQGETAGRGLTSEQRRRLKEALLSLSKRPKAKPLVKTMGVRGFVELRQKWLRSVEGKYDAFDAK